LARSEGGAGRGRIRGPRLVEIGRDHPRVFALGAAETTVGSDAANQIVLAEPTVSRRHAILGRSGRRFIVTDLESSNGTFVNGRRIAKSARIQAGDEVGFASSRFRLEVAPPAGARAKFTAFMIGLAVAMGVIAMYQFRADWQQIEIAEDYVASPTPTASVTPMPAAIAATATRKPTATPTATPRATPTATRTPHPHRSPRVTAPRRTARPKPTPTARPTPTVTMAPTASPTPPPVSSVSPTRTITPGFPTPVPIPPPSAASDWLGALNAYRAMVRLDPVTIDPKLNAGDLAHAKYLMANYVAKLAQGEHLGGEMHRKDPSLPGYSDAGREAAQHSDVNEIPLLPGTTNVPSWAIDS
jgi:FHA domain